MSFEVPLVEILRGGQRALTFWLAVNDVNTTDRIGRSLLIHAIRAQQPEIVRMLLKAGARTDIVDKLDHDAAYYVNQIDNDSQKRAILSVLREY